MLFLHLRLVSTLVMRLCKNSIYCTFEFTTYYCSLFQMLHLPCLSPATPLSTVRYIYTTLFLSVALIYIVCAIHICFIQLRQTYIYFFVYIYLHVTLIGFYWYIFKVCFRIQLFYLLDYFVDYIHVFYLFHMFCLFCLLIHIMFSYLLSYFLRL